FSASGRSTVGSSAGDSKGCHHAAGTVAPAVMRWLASALPASASVGSAVVYRGIAGAAGATKSGPAAAHALSSTTTARLGVARAGSGLIASPRSFIPQRFDGIEPGRLARRVVAEEDADSCREDESSGDRRRRDEGRP